MESKNLIPCSFCHKSFKQGTLHDCLTKIYEFLNPAAQIERNPDTLFNDVDNMVFQGGGIKGLAYLGVLDQLTTKENPNVFKNLKRVAGNSAGSILALYLGLNLEYSDIYDLMNLDYIELLDDGLALKVAINIDSWFGSYKYKSFRAKDVIFTAKENVKILLDEISKNPGAKEEEEQLKTMFDNIFSYYGSKFGKGIRTMLRVGAGTLAESAAQWLLEFLTSQTTKKAEAMAAQEAEEDEAEKQHALKDRLSSIIHDAFVRFHSEEETAVHDAQDFVVLKNDGTAEKPQSEQQQPEGDAVEEIDKETKKFYLNQSQQPAEDISDKSELKGSILHYAVAELLWFVVVSQVDANGFKKELGLFSGDLVKQTLIEGAIDLKFQKLGRSSEYREGLTFKELADFKDEKGNPLFKPIYVTSYNASNYKTEVFSVEHTPNVVVSDAVRASMSIPVFFQPVTIRENGTPRKVYYVDEKGVKQSQTVHYMDGGVLDNYPLWIFDDLRYCLDIPTWVPQRKIAVQNQKTLGFRLLDTRTIGIYKKPYFDEENSERKRISTEDYKGTFGFIMESLLTATVSSSEENDFIKNGDCPRSVFVDNLGVSAVAFDLLPKDKEKLINSGRKAVLDYKERAKTNFLNEGQKYY